MMYIEHTNLEDNLHQILTNRVPTSSSPSASEATAAVAASALLARVREAQNSASSTLQVSSENRRLNNSKALTYKSAKDWLKPEPNTSKAHAYKSAKDWLIPEQINSQAHTNKSAKDWLRPEPNLLPLENFKKLELPPIHNIVQQNVESATFKKADELQQQQELADEEKYELFEVIDTEQTAQAETFQTNKAEQKEQADRPNLASTSHFVIELQDGQKIENNNKYQPQNQLDEEEEFEYVVTRVPKRKLRENPTSQTIYYNPEKKPKILRRPVPEAIPIDSQLRPYNGDLAVRTALQPPTNIRNYSTDKQKYYTQRELVNGYGTGNNDDCDYYSDSETVEKAASTERPAYAYKTEFYSRQEAQMGLDILNKLKHLFNWNPSTNHYSTVHQEDSRKRRSDDWSGETSAPHQIKYRKVENRFPKYIAARSEEDDINEFLPPLSHYSQQYQQQQQKYSGKYDKQYLINNSAAQISNRTLSEMSNRRSNSIDKPTLRKSMFSAPPITQQIIKNTTYADVEFSDDEEPILIKDFDIKPSTSAAAAVKHVPKVFNIPILRTDERLKSLHKKPPPPPLIEPRTGSILQSSLIPELETSRRKPTYAETLRQNDVRLGGGTGHVLGGRCSHSSSGASTSESSRIFNGLNTLRTNHWSTQNRSSILHQEKESEEREKYQQLLEQVVPRLYGSAGGENKFSSASSSTSAAAQRRRSGLLLGTAITSSARSSPAANRRSLGLGQSILKRPPLSSTINLDDDDIDDDVTVTGISQLKTLRSSKAKQSLPTTVILDDDEISDIVDLGNEERHVLSTCAKIQKEKNSLSNLCDGKVEKPKDDALPYVEPVNSLQERFSASPHIKENWLENFQTKWLQRKKNRHDEVKETVKVAEKLAAERRAAEAEIQERLRKFQIVDPELLVVDDFEDGIEEPEFVELTQEHRARINAAICGPLDQILISKFNLNISRRDVHTLCGHNWLNDEVINFYMNLLTERGEKKHDSHGLPRVYAMNTFFVPRLLQAGHAGVKRWTRKVDIFSKDILPVPVHVGGVHWCMAIIHLKNRTIKYYDSMGTPNPNVLKALEQYLKDESLDKRNRPYDTSGFHIESVQGVPRQMNGSDCGVFSCMFAEYMTRNREITFTQQNMEYFRQKMILEIVRGELLQ